MSTSAWPMCRASPPHLAYENAAAFLDDLYLLRDSLISHGDRIVAMQDLQALIRLVESFGFHLLQLDIRQESTVHTRTVAAVLQQIDPDFDYTGATEAERLQRLAAWIGHIDPIEVNDAALDDEAREALAVFRRMAKLQAEVGDEVFGTYVISMTHSASHVMEVMLLARLVGLCGHNGATGSAASWWRRCSRRWTTCSAARPFSTSCCPTRSTVRWSRPTATARKSCSAIPIRARTAAFWRRTGISIRRSFPSSR
jgi:phosphoenolpyruvate carboxylase